MKRRSFIINFGFAAAGTAFWPMRSLSAPASSPTRRVAVFSDIHIGKTWSGLDGAQWFDRALSDIDRNVGKVDYAMSLGDITHEGDRESLLRYTSTCKQSPIPSWFELAGNHDHRNRGIRNYRRLLRSPRPYVHLDGNIAWFLVSTESADGSGRISPKNIRWLERSLTRHSDKVCILCTHQPPYRTLRRSNEDQFCLHPRWRLRNLVRHKHIDLLLCGHEHHEPYSARCIGSLGGTTLINAASTNHAYSTGSSESVILEMEEGAKVIRVRRRCHDKEVYAREFEVEVPLKDPISLKKRPRRRETKRVRVRSWRAGRQRRLAPSR